MYTCISMKDWRDLHVGMLASEAILGQKQSHSSYMARGALHPILAVHVRTYYPG